MSRIAHMELDYSGLTDDERAVIERALSNSENEVVGYIPEKKFEFVLRNHMALAERGVLERNWMTAYLQASHFADTPLSTMQAVFDACDRAVLQEHYPIPALPRASGDREPCDEDRYSLFRGCAGPDHRMGMSWISSLDKAIWYATQHAEYRGLTNLAVYATTVARSEIYCCGGHFDLDCIVLPKTWWKIDVPRSEFRLDRPRWP